MVGSGQRATNLQTAQISQIVSDQATDHAPAAVTLPPVPLAILGSTIPPSRSWMELGITQWLMQVRQEYISANRSICSFMDLH